MERTCYDTISYQLAHSWFYRDNSYSSLEMGRLYSRKICRRCQEEADCWGHPFYVPCGIVRFVRALSHAIFFLNIAKSRKDRIGRDTAFYFIGAFWFYCYDSPSGQQMGSIFSRATRKRPAANTKRHFDDYAPHHSHFPDCSFIFVSNFSINIT